MLRLRALLWALLWVLKQSPGTERGLRSCQSPTACCLLSRMERLITHWSEGSPLVLSTVAVGLSSIAYLLVKARSGPPKGLVYPPGPPQDPIIGNLRNFPKEDLFGTCNKWQKMYGKSLTQRLCACSDLG
jgi:hypothetical protein